MKKTIQPLVKNTINTKHVNVKGKNDFSSSISDKKTPVKSTKELKPIITKDSPPIKKEVIKENDNRKKAIRTQKMSDDVILKIDILKPFLKELEEMDGKFKPTINDMVDLLLDNYVHTKLSTKQIEAYQSMYKMRYDQL